MTPKRLVNIKHKNFKKLQLSMLVYDNKYKYKNYQALGVTEERKYFFKKIGKSITDH